MELIEFNRLKTDFNYFFQERSVQLISVSKPNNATSGISPLYFKNGRRLRAHRKNNLFFITINLMKSGRFDDIIIFRLNGHSKVCCFPNGVEDNKEIIIKFRKRKKPKSFYFKDVDFVMHTKMGNINKLEILKTDFGPEWFSFKTGDVNIPRNTFFKKIICKDKYIYEVLLDQHLFYGLGEYLVSEIIGRTGFELKTKISALDTEQKKHLYYCICYVLLESYRLDGIGYDLMGEDCEYSPKLKVYKKSTNIFRYREYNIYTAP